MEQRNYWSTGPGDMERRRTDHCEVIFKFQGERIVTGCHNLGGPASNGVIVPGSRETREARPSEAAS